MTPGSVSAAIAAMASRARASGAERQELQNLRSIESRVTDRRRHQAPAPQEDRAPGEAEQRRHNRDVVPLDDMAGPEHEAVEHQPEAGAAQVLVEPVQHEGPLHFLLDSAGEDDQRADDQRVARRLDERLERVGVDVVQRRPCDPQREHHQDDAPEDDRDEAEAQPAFAHPWAPAEHTGECILMHYKPHSFHKFHRSLKKIFGRFPK